MSRRQSLTQHVTYSHVIADWLLDRVHLCSSDMCESATLWFYVSACLRAACLLVYVPVTFIICLMTTHSWCNNESSRLRIFIIMFGRHLHRESVSSRPMRSDEITSDVLSAVVSFSCPSVSLIYWCWTADRCCYHGMGIPQNISVTNLRCSRAIKTNSLRVGKTECDKATLRKRVNWSQANWVRETRSLQLYKRDWE
jgi:hypothetical protein